MVLQHWYGTNWTNNMKKIIHILNLIILGSLLSCDSQDNDLKITEYVNPLIGSLHGISCSPEATCPFGSVRLTPHKTRDTINALSFYNASSFHPQNTPDIRFLPVVTKPDTSDKPACYVKQNNVTYNKEQARLGYYGITFNNGIKIENAVTERCAIMYFQYPNKNTHALILDFTSPKTCDSVMTTIWKVNNRMLEGYSKSLHSENPEQTYFVIEFSQDCEIMVGNETFVPLKNGERFKAQNSYAWIDFGEKTNKILAKTSISAANIEGANSNLAKEISHWSFDKVERDAKQAWKKELQKIKVKSSSKEQQMAFYTSMYYALQTPAISSDANGNYKGPDGEIHSAIHHTHYLVNPNWQSLQDVPLVFIMTQKKRVRDILKSSQYDARFVEKTAHTDTLTDILDTNCQYILSAIGFYDTDDTNSQLQLGTPSFEKIVIRTAPDKRFVITTSKESDNHIYINEVWLNRNKLERSWVSIEEIMKGGKLNFTLINK